MATVMADKVKKVSADVVHGLLRHMNNVDGRATANRLRYKISRKATAVCGACAEAKSKQKSLPKQIEATIKLVRPKVKAKANNE